MLKCLEIRNIALIDSLTVCFSEGMNCLSGETGAGKSIIIDAIGCILGDRVSRDLIRTGSDSAFVRGLFSADAFSASSDFFTVIGDNKLDFDGASFELSREFDRSGKNTCKFNGKTVSLSVLRSIGNCLIDIHGQHENQSLLRTETHIALLDLFGGRESESLLAEYRSLRSACSAKISEIKKLSGDPSERARRIDLLRYQSNEISAAKLKPGEEEELLASHKLLANSEKISDSLASSYRALSGGKNGSSALDLTGEAMTDLKKISGFSKTLEDIYARTEEIYYNLQDLSSELRGELDNVTFAPDELDKIDTRLDAINSLKHKYGQTIEDVIAFGENAREEADALEGSEETIHRLEKEIDSFRVKMIAVCEKLHNLRVSTAEKLEKLVCAELADLEMPGAVFSVDISFDGAPEPEFSSTGLDCVEFLMSANRGEPLKPLARVASGGELSRIMLAIKKIFADVDAIPTMIFDEIDIGISGKTAASLGDKLHFISTGHQVICVTHLAQIAARADRNMIVSKSFNGTSTVTGVIIPDEEQRVREIARLLDGNPDSEIAISHAREMLRQSR